jgi:hypothetical protein
MIVALLSPPPPKKYMPQNKGISKAVSYKPRNLDFSKLNDEKVA